MAAYALLYRLSKVDEAAFEALQACTFSGDFDICEAVPAGHPDGYLVNPLGGVAASMTGPSR